jgi:hypothetical protein
MQGILYQSRVLSCLGTHLRRAKYKIQEGQALVPGGLRIAGEGRLRRHDGTVNISRGPHSDLHERLLGRRTDDIQEAGISWRP